MFKVIYCLICHTWIIVFIVTVLYLYIKGFKPYKHQYTQEFCTEVPSNLTPAELSTLMYQRITSSAFCAEVIKLLNDNVLVLEEQDGIKYLTKNPNTTKSLSKSEDYAVKMLLDVMGNGTKVKIDITDLFTKKQKNCNLLLNEYKIWLRLMRTEGVKLRFYEQKSQYFLVKRIATVGFILFIVNIVFKLFDPLGYLTLVSAILLIIFFIKIYKRTQDANEEYYKWLAFKRYLENIENFKEKIENVNEYLVYGTVLNVKGLEKKLTNKECYEEVCNVLNANIIKAILKGNRTL